MWEGGDGEQVGLRGMAATVYSQTYELLYFNVSLFCEI